MNDFIAEWEIFRKNLDLSLKKGNMCYCTLNRKVQKKKCTSVAVNDILIKVKC